jgi:hypothetical protein
MAGKADVLSGQQQKAIAGLLNQPTISAAAQAAGVGERTLYRWLDDPTFAAAYRAARRQAVAQAIARLQQLSSGAVAVLAQVASDKSAPASSRVAAATKILELSIRAIELEDLESRIAALEAQHANQNP